MCYISLSVHTRLSIPSVSFYYCCCLAREVKQQKLSHHRHRTQLQQSSWLSPPQHRVSLLGALFIYFFCLKSADVYNIYQTCIYILTYTLYVQFGLYNYTQYKVYVLTTIERIYVCVILYILEEKPPKNH